MLIARLHNACIIILPFPARPFHLIVAAFCCLQHRCRGDLQFATIGAGSLQMNNRCREFANMRGVHPFSDALRQYPHSTSVLSHILHADACDCPLLRHRASKILRHPTSGYSDIRIIRCSPSLPQAIKTVSNCSPQVTLDRRDDKVSRRRSRGARRAVKSDSQPAADSIALRISMRSQRTLNRARAAYSNRH